MFTNDDIKKLAQNELKLDLSNVKIVSAPNVVVTKKDGVVTVGGNSIPQKLRALSLYALNSEKTEISIEQNPEFNTLGAMIDVSRGGVMRPEKVKEYILKIALMGANRFMLYTEDIYTLKDYPHFGYVRGAYSDSELIDIDNFAAEL